MIDAHKRAAVNAPIALFGFRRPEHIVRALSALEACPEFAASAVFVFLDGPRTSGDVAAVEATRRAVKARLRSNMVLSLQEKNRGLATSIVTEVSTLCEEFGRVIVVEDDLIVHPATLTWLNSGLAAYEHHHRVMQISAYQYRVPEFETRDVGTFQRFATTWGWATWKRAWDHFDPAATGWEAVASAGAARIALDAGGAYPFSDMLVKQMNGQLDSWGIRWFWSVHRAGGLTLMPPRTLVRNEGIATAATHNSIGPLKGLVQGRRPRPWDQDGPPGFPPEVALRPEEEAAFRRGLRRTHAMRNHQVKKTLAAMGLSRFH